MTTSHRRLMARPTTSAPHRSPTLTASVATMTILLQVSVPSSFFSLSSNYSFKIQPGHHSCKNLTLEMDLTNTLASAVQLVPAPILVDYIRITTGSGAILRTLYSKESHRQLSYQCFYLPLILGPSLGLREGANKSPVMCPSAVHENIAKPHECIFI